MCLLQGGQLGVWESHACGMTSGAVTACGLLTLPPTACWAAGRGPFLPAGRFTCHNHLACCSNALTRAGLNTVAGALAGSGWTAGHQPGAAATERGACLYAAGLTGPHAAAHCGQAGGRVGQGSEGVQRKRCSADHSCAEWRLCSSTSVVQQGRPSSVQRQSDRSFGPLAD